MLNDTVRLNIQIPDSNYNYERYHRNESGEKVGNILQKKTVFINTRQVGIINKCIKSVLINLKILPFMRTLFQLFKKTEHRIIFFTLKKVLHTNPENFKYHIEFKKYLKRETALSKIEKDKCENIKFSILVPLFNTQERFLRELIQSVISQNYTNWELCFADGSDDKHNYIQRIIEQYALNDDRILYIHLSDNDGISANTNACAQLASGDFFALMDHDDLLPFNALSENAKAIHETEADVLYSDEDHLSLDGKHINPFFKPDWSPDLLYNQNYIGHFLVFRKTLFYKIGAFRSDYDGSQDYDLMLRFSEVTDKICHIPMILYSWRESLNSTASNANAKPYAHAAGKKALNDHLKRKYGEFVEACDSEYTFVYDTRFLLKRYPKVSIIVPMKDKWELTNDCIHSIIENSSYQEYEILVLDNRSVEKETLEWFEKIKEYDNRIRIIRADMDFNWSALNNYGVQHANGEVFIFLNNDTLVISRDWIERLTEDVIRKNVGAAGALLLYPDNTIQHAGVIVGMGGWADHVYKGMPPIHFGSPFVSPVLRRNVLAVTGACLAVSRKHFIDIGGFDEAFIICGSDVEFCIRAHEKGFYNIYDSHVKLYHLESKSRDSYIPEIDYQKSSIAYKPYRENIDPYYNINLRTDSLSPKVSISSSQKINYKNYLSEN